MLYVLLITACLVPVVPGVMLAKKNSFSPHWFWFSIIPFVGFMIMFVMYVNSPNNDKSKTQEEIITEKKKRQKKAFIGIMIIVFMFGIPLWIGGHDSIGDYVPYVHTMELLKTNKKVQDILGEGVRRSFGYTCKTVDNGNGCGSTELSFTVKGNKSKGLVFVEAYMENGIWYYNTIELNTETFGAINLLDRKEAR